MIYEFIIILVFTPHFPVVDFYKTDLFSQTKHVNIKKRANLFRLTLCKISKR